MRKLIFVAAALAAGMMSFAASAEKNDHAGSYLGAFAAISAKEKPAASGKKQVAKSGRKAKLERGKVTKQVAAHSKSRRASAKVASKARVKAHSMWTVSAKRKSARLARTLPKVGTKRMTLSLDPKNVTLSALATVPADLVAKPRVQYASIVSRYATSYGVPVDLAHAVISVESNYRADARGSAGEIGLMQIKPATARMMGYSGSAQGLFNPETNIKFGMKYLGMAHRLGGGATCGTILRYNAGHAAKRMNPVSSAYCTKVQRLLAGA
ncbi:MAG: lytic transglycosylase domain-containing protein [Rhizobiaceae bacterium]